MFGLAALTFGIISLLAKDDRDSPSSKAFSKGMLFYHVFVTGICLRRYFKLPSPPNMAVFLAHLVFSVLFLKKNLH